MGAMSLLTVFVAASLAVVTTVSSEPAASAAAGDPSGFLDTAYARGDSLSLRGWAWDADTTGPVSVHLYVDGRLDQVLTADQPRPDVANAFPAAGGERGWTTTVTIARPASRVCAYAINAGPGSQNTTLGCRTVTVVERGASFGYLDAADLVPGGIEVRGWAIDPDQAGQRVDVTFPDGTAWVEPPQETSIRIGRMRAGEPRPDVEAVFVEYGLNNGYRWVLEDYVGASERVCVDVTDGDEFAVPSRRIGCLRISRHQDPIGRLDEVIRVTEGRYRVRGWALDPDTRDAVQVHVAVTGPAGTNATTVASTTTPRHDVDRAYPGFVEGPTRVERGWDVSVDATVGAQVCAYAINVMEGSENTTLGCRIL